MLSYRLARRVGTSLFLFLVLVLTLFDLGEARADDGTVLLLVHGDDLPRERLRERVASELGKPVALASAGAATTGGVLTVTYRQAQRELAVTWDGPKRGTVSRVVSAPSSTDDVVRDAAMLAGNLARDEAEELMAPPPLPPPTPQPSAENAPVTSTADRTEPRETRADQDVATAGVFYPLATNFGRPWLRTHLDFNLIFGRVGQLDGFQLGGVNVISPAEGRGTGDANGMQLAWIANVVMGNAAGLQYGSGVNIVKKDFDGWQAAWVMNHTGGTMTGLQLASVNIAGDVRGAQLGVINVGQKVAGTMIGLVNVADDIDGVPIGLASVTKTGGVHPQLWSSTGTLGNIGIKLATKYTYTMPSGHFHRAYDRDFVGAGFTIGAHIPLTNDAEDEPGPAPTKGAYLDTDLSFAWLFAPHTSDQVLQSGLIDRYHQHLLQPRLRALFGYRFADHFGVFAGGGLLFQARLINDGDDALLRLGPEFVGGIEL